MEDPVTINSRKAWSWFTVRPASMTCLAIYLCIVGVNGLIGITIPFWVPACFALAASILIFIGK